MNAAARLAGRRDHLQKVLNRIHMLLRAELLVQLDGELLLACLLRRPGATLEVVDDGLEDEALPQLLLFKLLL